MSATAAALDPANLARQHAEDAQRCRDTLRRLVDLGMDLAASVHRRAMAQPNTPDSSTAAGKPAPDPLPALALAFDRLARTVRSTVALAHTLSEPEPKPRATPAAKPPPRVSKEVRQAFQRQIAGDPEPYATLSDAELAELDAYLLRLDRDSDGAFSTLSFADQLEAVSRDLGLGELPTPRPVQPPLVFYPWEQRTAPEDAFEFAARVGLHPAGQPIASGPTTIPRTEEIVAPPPHPNTCAGPPIP